MLYSYSCCTSVSTATCLYSANTPVILKRTHEHTTSAPNKNVQHGSCGSVSNISCPYTQFLAVELSAIGKTLCVFGVQDVSSSSRGIKWSHANLKKITFYSFLNTKHVFSIKHSSFSSSFSFFVFPPSFLCFISTSHPPLFDWSFFPPPFFSLYIFHLLFSFLPAFLQMSLFIHTFYLNPFFLLSFPLFLSIHLAYFFLLFNIFSSLHHFHFHMRRCKLMQIRFYLCTRLYTEQPWH